MLAPVKWHIPLMGVGVNLTTNRSLFPSCSATEEAVWRTTAKG